MFNINPAFQNILETLVQWFWTLISVIMMATAAALILFGVAMAVCLSVKASMAECQQVPQVKESEKLVFDGVSRAEMEQITTRLMREDARKHRRRR